MFSGKTALLVERLTAAEKTGRRVAAFKPQVDTRSASELVSQSGATFPAVAVAAPRAIVNLAVEVDEVGVDEAQFFPLELIDVLDELRHACKHVYVCGLDLDFRGESFGPMPRIVSVADQAVALVARCDFPGCHEPGTRTQRLVANRPASRDSPTILIGGREEAAAVRYEARCARHHDVPKTAGAVRPRP